MTPDCAPDSQELDEHDEQEPDEPIAVQRRAVLDALATLEREDMTGRPTASAVVGDYTALSSAMQKLQRRHWRSSRL